mgnify:FL=1
MASVRRQKNTIIVRGIMLNSFPRFFSGMRAAVWLWVQPAFLFCMYSVLAQALYFFQLAFINYDVN